MSRRAILPRLSALLLALAAPAAAQAPEAGAPPFPPPAAGAARGNPLWGISVQSLTATRERPLFTPGRRPPPSAEPTPLIVPAATAPAPPPRPPLALIGTVVGPNEGFGIFLDQTSNTVIHLRTGDVHRGWTLKQVTVRGVLLQMDRRSAELALPPPDKAAVPAQSGARRRKAERPFPNEPDPSSH